MEKLELWDRDGLAVWVGWTTNGDLTISGQDFRGSGLGGGEYEYFLTVKAEDIPTLTKALGCDREGLLSELERQAEKIIHQGERTWLQSLGMHPEFHSF